MFNGLPGGSNGGIPTTWGCYLFAIAFTAAVAGLMFLAIRYVAQAMGL